MEINFFSNGKPGKGTAGANLSCWFDVEEPLAFEELKEDKKADAVIVGGGIAGAMTAYCLCKAGKKVILVEDGNIGSGETGHTTAHLTAVTDAGFTELEKLHGPDDARLAADSHRAAIDFIEDILLDENIYCDYARVNAYLFLHPSDKTDLTEEFRAALRQGFDCELMEEVPGVVKALGPCIKFSRQAQLHPLKFLAGLCRAITENGGEIFTGTHADLISGDGIVTDTGVKIIAKHIVVATNSPVNDKYLIPVQQHPFRSYAIAAKVKRGNILPALWWDSGDAEKDSDNPPYHYVRVQKLDDDYDLLICGGEDHRTGMADEDHIVEEVRYRVLETWARNRFNFGDVIYKWSGQVHETLDGLAYIGRNPLDKSNVYIATGFSGNGITYGAISGMLLADLVNGKENPWEKLYNPSRMNLKAGASMAKEIFYGSIGALKEKFTNTRHAVLDKIKPNEATIIKHEGTFYGVYRDHENHLHVVNAKCTHLGCTVKWNNSEKSWDCPCHGSRFTHEGTVINGPANHNLEYHTAERTVSSE